MIDLTLLQPKRTSALYWKTKVQDVFNATQNYPCFIDHTSECENTFNGGVYGLPCYEYPGMIKVFWIDFMRSRCFSGVSFETCTFMYACTYLFVCFQVCLHNGPAIDPDARDDVDHSWVEKNTSEYVRRHVMSVEAKPSIAEHCIYTVSFSIGDPKLLHDNINSNI